MPLRYLVLILIIHVFKYYMQRNMKIPIINRPVNLFCKLSCRIEHTPRMIGEVFITIFNKRINRFLRTIFQRKININAVTGRQISSARLLEAGERIVNLMQMFNLKHGLNPLEDYRLPKRFETPHQEGGAAFVSIPFDQMINEYYDERDWPNGTPSREKLAALNLSFCRDEHI